MSDDIREQLAALAHEQWSGWMLYLFQKSDDGPNGSVVIPAELVSRWLRQMTATYAELPENEKDSDRDEADKMLAIIGVLDGD
jgi:hypothetical protein